MDKIIVAAACSNDSANFMRNVMRLAYGRFFVMFVVKSICKGISSNGNRTNDSKISQASDLMTDLIRKHQDIILFSDDFT